MKVGCRDYFSGRYSKLMRALDNLSGPWTGWSIQDGRRINETLDFLISSGSISGTGSDADGEFNMEGEYDSEGNVEMIRRYSFCNSGPEGVGIPYMYLGRWDGQMIHGRWSPVSFRQYGGPFEMWPATEDISIEEMLGVDRLVESK